MSKIKLKSADAQQVLEDFAGLGGSNALCGSAAIEMRNFRLLSDGTLEKRCGWQPTAAFYGEVRGVWQGTLGSAALTVIAAECSVYRMEDGTPVKVGALNDSVGRVSFVKYRERLYLLDGDCIYVLDNAAASFRQAHGYAPLYGHNWHPTDGGEVNEPLNLLSTRLRVHYFNTTGSTVFHLPYYAAQIDCVRVDNSKITDFGFSPGSNKVTVHQSGAYVEIAFTMAYAPALREKLLYCTRALCELTEARECLLLYGGKARNKLFSASTVDDNQLNYCKVSYLDADPLYFKASNVLTVGAEDAPVTSLCRQHGRILAFCALGAASISFEKEGDGVECYPILRGVGCTAPLELSLNGDPVIVNAGGIFKLSSPVSAPDEFQLTCLTDEVSGMLFNGFLQNAVAFSDVRHGELWFRDPNDVSGLVWVYNVPRKCWYTFDGINASFFLELNGCIGFAFYDSVCLFDEIYRCDGAEPFEAVWQSSFLAISSPEDVKRALRVTLVCENTEAASLTLTTEKRSRTLTPDATRHNCPDVCELRPSLGRFRLLRITLRDAGESRSHYYRLAIYANL